MAEAEQARPLLRLIALDGEDLSIISAHVQDALVRVADIAFLGKEHRLALLLSRFDWACSGGDEFQRCRSGLHFDHVRRVSSLGIDRQNPETLLNLLSIIFEAGDAPSGTIHLTFSGGATIKLEVECIDAQFRDLGPRWAASARPGHKLAEDDVLAEDNPLAHGAGSANSAR